MALITDIPADVPGTNALDDIPDELIGAGPAPAAVELAGKTLLVMDEPPNIGDFVKIEITLKCREDGRKALESGELVHFRRTNLIAAKVTTQPYKPEPEADAEPEPGLFDDDGNSEAE
jgi:hypothetical protein